MYAAAEDPNTIASCPVCKWRGRAAEGTIDVDCIYRCPTPHCRAPLERFDTDPPALVSDETEPDLNAITK